MFSPIKSSAVVPQHNRTARIHRKQENSLTAQVKKVPNYGIFGWLILGNVKIWVFLCIGNVKLDVFLGLGNVKNY